MSRKVGDLDDFLKVGEVSVQVADCQNLRGIEQVNDAATPPNQVAAVVCRLADRGQQLDRVGHQPGSCRGYRWVRRFSLGLSNKMRQPGKLHRPRRRVPNDYRPIPERRSVAAGLARGLERASMELARSLRIDSVSRLTPSPPHQIGSDRSVSDAVSLMKEKNVGCILVCDAGRL